MKKRTPKEQELERTLQYTTAFKNLTHEDIIKQTANYFHLSTLDVYRNTRELPVPLARQVIGFLLRQAFYKKVPYTSIAEKLCYDNHVTVMYSERKVKGYLDTGFFTTEQLTDILNGKQCSDMSKYKRRNRSNTGVRRLKPCTPCVTFQVYRYKTA